MKDKITLIDGIYDVLLANTAVVEKLGQIHNTQDGSNTIAIVYNGVKEFEQLPTDKTKCFISYKVESSNAVRSESHLVLTEDVIKFFVSGYVSLELAQDIIKELDGKVINSFVCSFASMTTLAELDISLRFILI